MKCFRQKKLQRRETPIRTRKDFADGTKRSNQMHQQIVQTTSFEKKTSTARVFSREISAQLDFVLKFHSTFLSLYKLLEIEVKRRNKFLTEKRNSIPLIGHRSHNRVYQKFPVLLRFPLNIERSNYSLQLQASEESNRWTLDFSHRKMQQNIAQEP